MYLHFTIQNQRKNVGEYTSPMDGMGKESFQTSLPSSFRGTPDPRFIYQHLGIKWPDLEPPLSHMTIRNTNRKLTTNSPFTPLKINGWNLQITNLEKKMIGTKPPWLCSMLIFRGIYKPDPTPERNMKKKRRLVILEFWPLDFSFLKPSNNQPYKSTKKNTQNLADFRRSWSHQEGSFHSALMS